MYTTQDGFHIQEKLKNKSESGETSLTLLITQLSMSTSVFAPLAQSYFFGGTAAKLLSICPGSELAPT